MQPPASDADPPRADLSGCTLLAIFAHPDDESLAAGGLLAMCADLGVRVSLLCLTHGEHGPGGEGLRAARAGELRDASRVLGITEVVLLDHEDGMLPWIDPGLLETDITEAIVRGRPDVVITFDEDGLYWHPDHIAVHERATSAVAGLGESAPALLYVSLPGGAMRAIVDSDAADPAASDRADGDSGSGQGILGVADADAFGSMAREPTLVLEAGASAARKLAALRCHRSQVEGGPLDRIKEPDARRLLGVEHYRRADVGSRGPTFVEGLVAPAHR